MERVGLPHWCITEFSLNSSFAVLSIVVITARCLRVVPASSSPSPLSSRRRRQRHVPPISDDRQVRPNRRRRRTKGSNDGGRNNCAVDAVDEEGSGGGGGGRDQLRTYDGQGRRRGAHTPPTYSQEPNRRTAARRRPCDGVRSPTLFNDRRRIFLRS